jgi:hypothetical protein
LSNEKYRGIRLNAKPDLLTLQAHNPDQEEAEDQIEVAYAGEEIEIGFNVTYLLDALMAIDTDRVHIALSDANSSCLITGGLGRWGQVRRHADATLRDGMSLAELTIENLRCIEKAELTSGPGPIWSSAPTVPARPRCSRRCTFSVGAVRSAPASMSV